MQKSINFDKMTLGTCYYPEHWERSMWESDLERMEECGIEIIRIAEFAWNLFEPSEGNYCFGFFDEFLEVVKNYNIKVIFCTPTATPPAWLTNTYPEVLNAKVDGTLLRHGMRRHYNYNSKVYQDFTRKIVTQLALHYSGHESIIGWQIDNELNCEIDEFYSESDHNAFRVFLQHKYGTLDNLNDAWGTNFWSQTYTEWSQVYLRRPNISGAANPHLALDEKRFISQSCMHYCKLQSDILKAIIPESQFITHNGMFGHVDNHKMTEETMDFFCYDGYPNFAYSVGDSAAKDLVLKDRKWSLNLTNVRSISPNFGVMEQQSGAGGWVHRMMSASPKPGQMRLWTFQSVAHGADYVSFFRWRTCGYGTEIYWHGINDYSNIPNRRVEEVKQIHGDFKNIADLAKSKYQAEFALLQDYDNEWDGELDIWHGPLTKFSTKSWFTASTFTHSPMDTFRLRDCTTVEELLNYKMLVYPHAAILTEETADLLKAYVSAGGILIMGARTGYKDASGRCPMQAMPGYAADLCGVRVKDFTVVLDNETNVYMNIGEDSYHVQKFSDILEVTSDDAKVVARFEGDYYKDEPAVVENSYGAGKAVYCGSAFTAEIAEALLERYGLKNPHKNVVALPKCCELAVREKDGKQYYIVLNYNKVPHMIELQKEMTDRLTGKKLNSFVEMDGYGVLVLE